MLTAIILTRNESRQITACIESLRWVDEILVFDSYSEDNTIALSQQAGAKIAQHPFENYSTQRNAALKTVPNADWVFFVDADERATPELAAEITRTINLCAEVGWWVPRHNYIFGHRMRGAGWWPDHQLRLLHREHAHYDPARAVHEEAILDGKSGYLKAHLIHYNYETIAQFHAKQRKYTDYDAQVLLAKGTQPHVYTPYTQFFRHFWWRWVSLAGWRDGGYGLLLSLLMAYYELLKYRQVRRLLSARYRTEKVQG